MFWSRFCTLFGYILNSLFVQNRKHFFGHGFVAGKNVFLVRLQELLILQLPFFTPFIPFKTALKILFCRCKIVLCHQFRIVTLQDVWDRNRSKPRILFRFMPLCFNTLGCTMLLERFQSKSIFLHTEQPFLQKDSAYQFLCLVQRMKKSGSYSDIQFIVFK